MLRLIATIILFLSSALHADIQAILFGAEIPGSQYFAADLEKRGYVVDLSYEVSPDSVILLSDTSDILEMIPFQDMPTLLEELVAHGINIPYRYVCVENHELWTEALGNPQDTPILLICGAGCHAHFWNDYICQKLIQQGYYVIRYDHRDVGLSSASDEPYDLDVLAEDAIQIIDAYNLDNVHLIGHSMGGFISQLVAARYPERIASLTLIGTGPVGPTRRNEQPMTVQEIATVAQTMHVMFSHGLSADFEKTHIAFHSIWEHLSGNTLVEASLTYPYVHEMYTRTRPHHTSGYSHFSAIQKMIKTLETRRGIFEFIQAPALIIHGALDPLILPQRGGIALHDALPNSELLLIPEMGHVFFNETLEDQIFTTFLKFMQKQQRPQTVVGLQQRISSGTAFEEIKNHWEHFETADFPLEERGDLVAIYSDYEGDETQPYNLTIGYFVDVDKAPEGWTLKQIPAANYGHIHADGPIPDSIVSAWQKVWQSSWNRSFQYDYEVYGEQGIDLYIGVNA